MADILSRLTELSDPAYRAFQSRLIPTVPMERVLGVRIPALRALAREIAGSPEACAFLLALPHRFYDEDNLHALLLNDSRDENELIDELHRFLPLVDNWATCDLLSPALFRRHPDALPEQAHAWILSGQEYAQRFGIGVLMRHYLTDFFRPEYLDWVASVRTEAYYVRMMIAWFFAEALAARPDGALPYWTQRRLEPWIHNKAIQKAVESRRISPEQKQFLRSLRI